MRKRRVTVVAALAAVVAGAVAVGFASAGAGRATRR